MQTEYLGNGVLRAAGVQVAEVNRVSSFGDDRDSAEFRDVIETLFEFYELDNENPLTKPYVGGGTLLDACLRALGGDLYDDNWFPLREELPNFVQVKRELLSYRKTKDMWDWNDFMDHASDSMLQYATEAVGFLVGRRFFLSDSYIGVVPRDTRRDDIICVLLGCRVPIVLRRRQQAPGDVIKWKVVGSCSVPGLMCGEAIGGALPTHYRPVGHLYSD